MKISKEKYMKVLPPSYAEIFEQGLVHNWTVEECADEFNFPGVVGITDTTLRDGEQQPGVFFTPEQKVEIAKKLAEIGIMGAEIGYPAVSEEEMKACKMIHAENIKGLLTFVMARAKKTDIDAALDADAKAVDLFTSCSEFHIKYKLKLTLEENINMYMEALDYATDHGLRVVFGREDDSRADIPYFVKIAKKALESGAMATGISDTTGTLTPVSTRWLISRLRKDGLAVGPHFHNDLGLATANTLAALEAGAAGVNGTILGLGERAGNAPIEEVVLALRTLYGIKTRVDMEGLYELCKMVSKFAGVPIHVNKPIVGANAFKHESGIHAHGVLAHPLTYESIPHEWLGRKSEFRYGKFSGTAVVLKEALEPLGLVPSHDQLLEIVSRVKAEQLKRGKDEFEQFVEEYNRMMDRMGLTLDEVTEIAKQVVNGN
ncbi:MAG: homoaconitate hydratase [Halobacteriota archaeon]|nr:homoaconitate hydratase [Halobacteriota archaeon]